jgi:hypothetical protein
LFCFSLLVALATLMKGSRFTIHKIAICVIK